jgi:hypothetical protein
MPANAAQQTNGSGMDAEALDLTGQPIHHIIIYVILISQFFAG